MRSPFEIAEAAAIAGRDADPGTEEARTNAQKALLLVWQEIQPLLGNVSNDNDQDERSRWLAALRFLATSGIFRDEVTTLAVALAELERGVVHPSLRPIGSAQGGKTSSEKLYWQAIVVEAFELLVEQEGDRGGADGSVGRALDIVEDEIGLSSNTMKAWQRRVSKAPPEFQTSPGALRWRFGKGGVADPLAAMRLAIPNAK